MRTKSIILVVCIIVSCERTKTESRLNTVGLQMEQKMLKYCRYDYWGDCEDYMTHKWDTVLTGNQNKAVNIKLYCAHAPSLIDTLPAVKEKDCDYHIYSFLQNIMEIRIKSDNKESVHEVTPMTFINQFEISGNSEVAWLARKGYIRNDYKFFMETDSSLTFEVSIMSSEIDIGVQAYFQIDNYGALLLKDLEPYDLAPPF